MTESQMRQRIAHLESMNDQLVTEITYVDELMRNLGFNDGIATVKATAQEILSGADEEVL